MSDEAHIIDIDSLVLIGVDTRHPDRLHGLIEVEVRRMLEGTGLHSPTAIANSETRVAGEVARAVVRFIQGGSDRV